MTVENSEPVCCSRDLCIQRCLQACLERVPDEPRILAHEGMRAATWA